jgi:hypothetical protein
MHDRRQHAEKQFGVHALKPEITAHARNVAAAVQNRRLARRNCGEEIEGVDWRRVRRAVKAEGLAARQQNEITGFEQLRRKRRGGSTLRRTGFL